MINLENIRGLIDSSIYDSFEEDPDLYDNISKQVKLDIEEFRAIDYTALPKWYNKIYSRFLEYRALRVVEVSADLQNRIDRDFNLAIEFLQGINIQSAVSPKVTINGVTT